MKIAVINVGSSSLKCKVFDIAQDKILYAILIENIGEEGALYQTHEEALLSLDIDFLSLDAIGHRVVHGGELFKQSVLIDTYVIDGIRRLIPLAPLHNNVNLEGILLTRKYAPNVAQIAVFDTAFHSTMPEEAYRYALHKNMYQKNHIRRYGFHGTSHAYVAKESAKKLQKDLSNLNLITLHLGNGASICAVEKGKSIDTSMGFTPLEGLIMGTRSGDIDSAIVLYMQKELGLSVEEVEKELNKKSGLLGLSGSNDVRKILERKDDDAILAIKMMVRRIQKYIGSYMAILGDIDAIVFTGGIGENSKIIREMVMQSKMFTGIDVLVIKTDEEKEIALECVRVLENN